MADIADNVPFTNPETAISQGKRHLLVRDYTMAVTALAQACELLAKKHGDTADELGEPYLLYGRALLGLAREEAGVLGGGVPGSEEAQENEDGEDDDEDEVEGDEGDEENLAKINEDENEENEEKEDEDTEEDKEVKKEEAKEEDKEVKKKEKAKEGDEGEKKKEETKGEKKKEETKGEKKKEETKEEKKEEEKKEDDKKEDEDKKEEKKADDKENVKDEKAKETEEKAKKDDKAEEPKAKEKNAVESEGETSNGASSSKQQNGDIQENGDQDSEEIPTEEEEEVNNLQVAWEVLELAKLVLLKRGPSGWKLLADSHRLLGEVAMEGGNHKGALHDLEGCLDLLEKIEPREPRAIAEIHYQLGLAHSLGNDFDASIEEFNKATMLLESRIKELEAITEAPKTDDPFYTVEGEIQELKDLLPEIQEKISDMKDFKQEACKLVIESIRSEIASGSSNGAGPSSSDASSGSSSGPKVTKPVSDISHLVRKKRKADESETDVNVQVCKKPTPEKTV